MITALELSKVLDKFKTEAGNFDYRSVNRVGKQLKEFGPFYGDLLHRLSVEVNGEPHVECPKCGTTEFLCGHNKRD